MPDVRMNTYALGRDFTGYAKRADCAVVLSGLKMGTSNIDKVNASGALQEFAAVATTRPRNGGRHRRYRDQLPR